MVPFLITNHIIILIIFVTVITAAVIGFVDSNTSVTVVEGGPSQTVCLFVRPEGLGLDAFDQVPIDIMTDIGN